ncbi:hypothetical protein LSH36_486g02015 [Paralvinella palmiformis]|uniref:G-protein coupled receptors family 1 profile domain-containing protein n=1 Tax=Paralvinella palmiformis TaxID=53620 RepID=A0AAD9JAJ6_9ANNE|nr:hypothetical protein LSH36_486g02015 [Paralvinella palmiformis]
MGHQREPIDSGLEFGMSREHQHDNDCVINTDNINRSYVMGYDDDTGWDGYYHFTYFGQFRRANVIIPRLETALIGLITLAVICANVLVLVIMFTTKTPSSSNNYFLANMSLAAMVYPIGMPLIAVTRLTGTWIFSQTACSMLPYTELCGTMVSVWTMTLMSLERYRASQKKGPFEKRQVLVMVAVLWLISAASSVPLAIFFVIKESTVDTDRVIVCTLMWPNNDVRTSYVFIVPAILVGFVLPLILIVINYTRIMKALNDSMKKLHQHRCSGPPVVRTRSGMFNPKLFRHRREAKVIRFLIVLVVVFCTMWLPIAVCMILIVYDKVTHHLIMTSNLFIAGECFALSNSLVNPLIYAFINERYRNGLNRIVGNVRRVSLKTNKITPSTSQVLDDQV